MEDHIPHKIDVLERAYLEELHRLTSEWMENGSKMQPYCSRLLNAEEIEIMKPLIIKGMELGEILAPVLEVAIKNGKTAPILLNNIRSFEEAFRKLGK